MQPQSLTRVHLERRYVCAVVDVIEPITIDYWGGKPTLPTVDCPLRLFLFDLTFRARIYGDHHTHFAGVKILFTVSENGSCAMDDHAGIQAALADFILPNRFTGLRLDCVSHSVTRTLNQQPRAVDGGNDWWRIGRVVRSTTGGADPHCLSGLLIKRHEAMSATTVLAPLESYATNDYQIAVDDGRDCASPMGRQQTKVFSERSLPKNLPVFAHAQQRAAHSEDENVSRLGIADGRGPADSMRRYIAKKDIEAMLPKQLAGISVETHHPLLFEFTFARGVLQVDLIADHDRRRPAAVGGFPGKVLPRR